MPLFKQFSYLLRFTWHFLLAETVFTFKRNLISFNYYRADTTSLSYLVVTRIVHDFGTSY